MKVKIQGHIYEVTKIRKGNKGFLIRDLNGEMGFRIYDDNDKAKFSDYEIRHYDLKIIIDDQDAYFYKSEGDGDGFIDYSPQTLGIKIV
jgi:hypothetical protein